jgi:hypothetical protein
MTSPPAGIGVPIWGTNENGPPAWGVLESTAITAVPFALPMLSVSHRALAGRDGVPATFTSRLVGFDSGTAPSSKPISWRAKAPVGGVSGDTDPVSNRLFDLKVATAEVAMHLERAWRSGLFRQLDDLLDEDSWHADDPLPTTASYRTFLRLVIVLGLPRRPSIGCSQIGNLIASWRRAEDRLTIECRADDDLRWVLSRYTDGDRESAAGICKLANLRSRLAPYRPEVWFLGDEEPLRS